MVEHGKRKLPEPGPPTDTLARTVRWSSGYGVSSKGCRGEDSRAEKVANLDFEARVPVPFSIFPRTYKETEVETTTHTHEEIQIDLPGKPEKAGREGQYSSISASAQLPPPRPEPHFSEEEVRITREEERYRRPGAHREHYEEHRPHTSHTESHFKPKHSRPSSSFSYAETSIEVDRHNPHLSSIDRIEREYRARAQPSVYKDNISVAASTVDPPRPVSHFATEHTHVSESTIDPPKSFPSFTEEIRVSESTVDPPKAGSSYHRDAEIAEETVEYPRQPPSPSSKKSRMGYYDSNGHHHSLREGLHKMADRVFHSEGERAEISRASSSKSNGAPSIPNTVTIPCHHVRMGDILILQGRPCQVIRISTSSATGQHRYLGVDLFTKQLHEESSFVSNPAPSVVVQTMLGPVFKQYRVLDIQDGSVVAMTETGDVKTGVPVIDQSNLWQRLTQAFNAGHGSVRVLVLNDGGRELVVDMKVIHASSL
ncbi:Woronin body major protein [Daldinia childiae]|uniref:Woronin body major protein n=1 Tax=Daldinia childiae TaxID=326645 RepID=UPI001448A19A|nr:Woronin body major protein [Daldinia childiae]KAF3064197.1 Woronin body major protein [Daldinia childiae]